MLTQISLKNFKGYRDLKSLRLKPITVLCGANNTGKSTLLQSILLLKQSLEHRRPEPALLFDGELVRLGSFAGILHSSGFSDSITIELEHDVSNAIRTEVSPEFYAASDLFRELFGEHIAQEFEERRFSIRLLYSITFATEPRRNGDPEVIVKKLSAIAKVEDKLGQLGYSPAFEMNYIGNRDYHVEWSGIRTQTEASGDSVAGPFGTSIASFDFTNFAPTFVLLQDDKLDPDLEVFLQRLRQLLLHALLGPYVYLGPIREQPRRRYPFDANVFAAGVRGEYAPCLYVRHIDDEVWRSSFIDPSTGSFSLVAKTSLNHTGVTLRIAVNRWLELFGAYGLEAVRIDDAVAVDLESSQSGAARVSMADAGTGLSQVFPIVVEGLRMPFGGTLLVEEPEAHLHPRAQATLADFFIGLGLADKQVIIETHSEHIVNRLVRRIVEDDDGDLNSLIGIYFARSTSEGSVIEEIKVNDAEGISSWPPGFFDQSDLDFERTVRAGLSKRRARRS